MIWATLAFLGIPIWIIALILIAVVKNRNTVRSNPDIFAFKPKKGDGWTRGNSYARWVSDVIIFHSGIALIRSNAVKVDAAEVLDAVQLPSKGLGDSPTGLLFTYAGGDTITVAVSAENLDAALGPKHDSSTS